MDPNTFPAVQSLVDQIAEIAEKQLASEEIRRLIADLGNLVGNGKVASVNIVVEVRDEERECSILLLTTGLSAFPDTEPYRTWNDTTTQRYVLENGIHVVPNDRCPQCWQIWKLKFENPSCPHCGLTMGDDCKLLLDNDKCPWCNDGIVTVSMPKCDKCGHEVDRQHVVWG